MKRIIYQNNEGLKIIIPSSRTTKTLEEIAQKVVPNEIDYEIVNTEDLPNDRLFRSAWEKQGAKIKTNINKAKEISHKLRRVNREAQLVPLDKEINHNIANTNKIASIEAQREIIRTQNAQNQIDIDSAITEEELREILNRHY